MNNMPCEPTGSTSSNLAGFDHNTCAAPAKTPQKLIGVGVDKNAGSCVMHEISAIKHPADAVKSTGSSGGDGMFLADQIMCALFKSGLSMSEQSPKPVPTAQLDNFVGNPSPTLTGIICVMLMLICSMVGILWFLFMVPHSPF